MEHARAEEKRFGLDADSREASMEQPGQASYTAAGCYAPVHSRAQGLIRQTAEGVETQAGGPPLASASGEPGEAAAVGFDEAVHDRDQRACVEVAVDEVTPA